MKNIKIKYSVWILALVLGLYGCEQEVIVPVAETPEPPTTPSGTSGSANFSKFVSLGNSLVAGVQGNTVFDRSQAQSLPAIMNRQFAFAGGTATFNQPSVNSPQGFTGMGPNNTVLGRFVLQVGATGSVAPAPRRDGTVIGPFTGDKAALNNFGVPGILLGQVLTPLTGGPATGNPAFNALYARFATNPGVSTILGDAIAKSPTFFLFWLGNNDVLGYAVNGGDNNGIQITPTADFSMQYQAAIGTLLASNPELKGVVGNIPNVLAIPYFNLVPYNAIPMDAPTAAGTNAAYAGYNQLVGAAAQSQVISAAEFQRRQISFQAGANAVVISDEDLTDLGPFFDLLLSVGQINAATRAQLEPLRRARQMVAGERLTLQAAGILGTLAIPGNPLSVNGVAIPLADRFVLTANEINQISTAIQNFNGIIANVVAGTNNRVALADINAFFTTIATGGPRNIDGIVTTPDFAPPAGLFSEDGVHPNSRGYALAANEFIKAINAKFGATVPLAKITDYPSNDLPIPAQ